MSSFTRLLFALLLALGLAAPAHAVDADALPGVKRILFLGDSITYSGQYVDDFELFLFCRLPDREFQVIDCGLPSETVSGLSEEGHADGKFPRPDLHERLDRVLAKTKPDLIFACYGMNDGIYLPFDEQRFAKFRDGIERLHAKAEAAGAQIVHLTPPTFHPLSARSEPDANGKVPASLLGGYNAVLDRYAAWMLEQRAKGWRVIDIHGPMNAFIEEKRKTDPDFVFAKDGVHANDVGHALMAGELVRGISPASGPWFQQLKAGAWLQSPAAKNVTAMIRQRGRLLADAWLTDTGHLRPGMAKGLPVDQATTQAAELGRKIRAVLAENPPPQ